MSYICDKCGIKMPARSKPIRTVVERYPERTKVIDGEEVVTHRSGQIKREEDLCPECAGIKLPEVEVSLTTDVKA